MKLPYLSGWGLQEPFATQREVCEVLFGILVCGLYLLVVKLLEDGVVGVLVGTRVPNRSKSLKRVICLVAGTSVSRSFFNSA